MTDLARRSSHATISSSRAVGEWSHTPLLRLRHRLHGVHLLGLSRQFARPAQSGEQNRRTIWQRDRRMQQQRRTCWQTCPTQQTCAWDGRTAGRRSRDCLAPQALCDFRRWHVRGHNRKGGPETHPVIPLWSQDERRVQLSGPSRRFCRLDADLTPHQVHISGILWCTRSRRDRSSTVVAISWWPKRPPTCMKTCRQKYREYDQPTAGTDRRWKKSVSMTSQEHTECVTIDRSTAQSKGTRACPWRVRSCGRTWFANGPRQSSGSNSVGVTVAETSWQEVAEVYSIHPRTHLERIQVPQWSSISHNCICRMRISVWQKQARPNVMPRLGDRDEISSTVNIGQEEFTPVSEGRRSLQKAVHSISTLDNLIDTPRWWTRAVREVVFEGWFDQRCRNIHARPHPRRLGKQWGVRGWGGKRTRQDGHRGGGPVWLFRRGGWEGDEGRSDARFVVGASTPNLVARVHQPGLRESEEVFQVRALVMGTVPMFMRRAFRAALMLVWRRSKGASRWET